MSNKLINESSPYLLQHAHNPVNWYAWGEEALNKAKSENKLILVSIGYSACHWCHVMEHETFEDEEAAAVMNESFVCIKIDREERPDIDQVYMTAVQLMTNQGGWPLNCICLPDQRPVYGGTYFRKHDWMNLLHNLAAFWEEKPAEAIDYAAKLTDGIRQSEQLVTVQTGSAYTTADLEKITGPWKRRFDLGEGGYDRAPKFPLPNNWQFLLRYAHLVQDNAIHVSTLLTLHKMAFGGIYDHIGGGFARYSVDARWHVPHFEKMLYDNAQLVSLYSEAYQHRPDGLFKQVVFETLDFISREMTSPEGGFYSALDADSEGVEGKFYTFTKAELIEILGTREEVFSLYYNVTEPGNWEEEHTNIFFRKEEDTAVAETLGLSLSELRKAIAEAKQSVFSHRTGRIRPELDDKVLAAWNGMMLKGYTDAYRVFGEMDFLNRAIKNANFILEKMRASDGGMYRNYKGGKATITAFLDDYAFVIDALTGLYECTFDEHWLSCADELVRYAIDHFYDAASGMFFYTSDTGEQLIVRKQEIMDNVIPASNSVMAHNLTRLGHLFDNTGYLEMARQMLDNVVPQIKSYGSAYSNWASLLLNQVNGMYEIAIAGEESESKRRDLEQYYIPNKILLGGVAGNLPLLKDKFTGGTKIFVCRNKTCQLPVQTAEAAFNQIINRHPV